MILKKISWFLFFSLSIFFSWQFIQGFHIFLFAHKANSNFRIMYLMWAILCLIVERPVLKKLLRDKKLKTYFGIGYPFVTEQISSIMLGFFMYFYLRTFYLPNSYF